jgi:hypothetical protein
MRAETAPKTKLGRVKIDLVGHFTRADLPAFGDWSRGMVTEID